MSFHTYPAMAPAPPSLDEIDRRLAAHGAGLGAVSADLQDIIDAALIYQQGQLKRVGTALKVTLPRRLKRQQVYLDQVYEPLGKLLASRLSEQAIAVRQVAGQLDQLPAPVQVQPDEYSPGPALAYSAEGAPRPPAGGGCEGEAAAGAGLYPALRPTGLPVVVCPPPVVQVSWPPGLPVAGPPPVAPPPPRPVVLSEDQPPCPPGEEPIQDAVLRLLQRLPITRRQPTPSGQPPLIPLVPPEVEAAEEEARRLIEEAWRILGRVPRTCLTLPAEEGKGVCPLVPEGTAPEEEELTLAPFDWDAEFQAMITADLLDRGEGGG